MAQYKTDLRDIYFNLFQVLKIHELAQTSENDLKDIISEYDKFNGNEIFPCRSKGDVEGVHLKDGVVKVPPSFHAPIKKLYENGWYGVGYSEDIGGIPTPHSVALVCQSLMNGANVSLAMYPGLTRGAMDVILQVGSTEQKDLIVPKMMTGEWGGTMCLTEPGAGSDVGAAITTATPVGDGTFKIKGIKIFISSGDNDLYQNIIHLVLARTPGAPQGTKGLSLFIVPKYRNDGKANDVRCTKIEEKMGIHGQATCELTFGANGDCIGTLIGKEFEGMANMFIMMNEARLLCGVQAESQSNMVYSLTEQYAKERSQFGKEIINHPDVKRTLIKMRSMSRALRSLVLYTADLFDRAHHGEKDLADEIALLTPICKAYCSDEGFNVTIDAIQIHGGYGFCSEYGIEQFARDTKISTIYEGTNGIQAIDFTMRKVLKDNAKTFMNVGLKIQKAMAHPIAQKEFKDECTMMIRNLEKARLMLEKLGKLMKENKADTVLYHATNFLNYSGNLICAWRLLESALVASGLLENATTEDEKKYLSSKIVDFRFFVQHQLVKNISLSTTVLNFNDDVASLNV